jgi:3',5'-cyclic-AMP phosphodiesterase
MKRRDIIKNAGILSAAVLGGSRSLAGPAAAPWGKRKHVLRIAHITDVHIRPETECKAMSRFKVCLEKVRKDKPDIILNGGDSVFAVDYDDIRKDRVLELWKCWNDSVAMVRDIPMYSVLGNHDMWWKGGGDELYGKPGALKMLGLQRSYYSFDRNGWHFIMLDSNHPQTAGMLDEEQWKWFVNDVEQNSKGQPTLIMSHYPLLSCTGIIDNKPDFIGPFKVSGSYNHLDILKFIEVFNRNKNIRVCLSGHIHLLDRVWYNGVQYLCNGATSGYWWGAGDDGKGSYKQTGPGYSILELYDDGSFEDRYILYES